MELTYAKTKNKTKNKTKSNIVNIHIDTQFSTHPQELKSFVLFLCTTLCTNHTLFALYKHFHIIYLATINETILLVWALRHVNLLCGVFPFTHTHIHIQTKNNQTNRLNWIGFQSQILTSAVCFAILCSWLSICIIELFFESTQSTSKKWMFSLSLFWNYWIEQHG